MLAMSAVAFFVTQARIWLCTMPDRLCRHHLHSRGNGRLGFSPRPEEFLGHHLELSFDLRSMFLAVYPPQLAHPGREPGRWHRFWGDTIPYWPKRPLRRKWWRKIAWMLTICLAPEIGVAVAVAQWLKVREELSRVNANSESARKFTMTQAFFAKMGGIVVRDVLMEDAGEDSGALGGAFGRPDQGNQTARVPGDVDKERPRRGTENDMVASLGEEPRMI